MIGRTVGNYIVREKIGEGGMGTVYRAEHPRIGRSVAIKVLRPEYQQDPQIVTRFLNEAKAAHDIGNEHIVEILDFGEMADGTFYITMEWLSGHSLAALLRTEPRLPLRRTLHIIAGVGRALAAAHAHGVIHRDLKPDNIFLVQRGEDPDFVKVLDFGLAKLLHPSEMQAHLRTQTHAFFGTPAYMSPEQCRAAHRLVDQRSDVYALGVILYEMAVGRRPFIAEDLPGILVAHLTEAPPVPRSLQPALPAAVEDMILRALQKPPEARFQTMTEFLHALSGVVGTTSSPAPVGENVGPANAAGGAAGGIAPVAASPTEITTLGASAEGCTEAGASQDPTVGVEGEVNTLNAAAAEAFSIAGRLPRRALLLGTSGLVAVAVGFLSLWSVMRPSAPAPSHGAAISVSPGPPGSPAPKDRQPTLAASAAHAPSPSRPAAKPLPSSESSSSVHIAIRAVPPETQLILDEAGLENPFVGDLARTAMRRLLVAKARGYRSESRWVTLDHDQEVIVRLERSEDEQRGPVASPNERGAPRATSRRTVAPSRPGEMAPRPQGTKPQGTKPRILTDFSE